MRRPRGDAPRQRPAAVLPRFARPSTLLLRTLVTGPSRLRRTDTACPPVTFGRIPCRTAFRTNATDPGFGREHVRPLDDSAPAVAVIVAPRRCTEASWLGVAQAACRAQPLVGCRRRSFQLPQPLDARRPRAVHLRPVQRKAVPVVPRLILEVGEIWRLHRVSPRGSASHVPTLTVEHTASCFIAPQRMEHRSAREAGSRPRRWPSWCGRSMLAPRLTPRVQARSPACRVCPRVACPPRAPSFNTGERRARHDRRSSKDGGDSRPARGASERVCSAMALAGKVANALIVEVVDEGHAVRSP